MIKTDLLYQLIKSLSRGEKRNFKVLTQLTAGDKKYIQVFDSIDRMEQYDEEKLIRELNDEAFTRQFSVAKNYLYNSILKSLAYFYKGQVAENFALSLQVRILMEKRLFNQAYKHLNKAMERAEKQENFYEILQLFLLERQILRQTDDYKKLNERIHEINLREKIILEKLNNFQQYHFMYDQIVTFITTDPKAKGVGDISFFDPILSHNLMESESQALSIKARIRFYTIMHRYFRFTGNRRQALPYIEKIIKTYESYPEILEDEWMRYVEEVSALVSEYGHNNKKDEAMKALKKLDHPRIKSRNGIDYYFPFYYTQLIGIYLNIGDIPRAAAIVGEFEIDLPKNAGKIPKYQELRLYYLAGQALFMNGEPLRALKFINLFLNEPRMELMIETQCLVRITHLLIQFELGNLKTIENEIKSASRFLFKKGRLLKFEKALFHEMQAWSRLTSADIPVESMERLLSFLKTIENDPIESFAPNALGIRIWIQARMEGKTMGELYALSSLEQAKV